MNPDTTKPEADCNPRLVRISADHLDPQSICGLPAHFGSQDKCGGKLMVKDWHPQGLRAGRYELYCEKCHTCDPNGHSRQDILMSEGLEYFDANKALDPTAWALFAGSPLALGAARA